MPVERRADDIRAERLEEEQNHIGPADEFGRLPRRLGVARVVRRQVSTNAVLVNTVSWNVDGVRVNSGVEHRGIAHAAHQTVAVAIEVGCECHEAAE